MESVRSDYIYNPLYEFNMLILYLWSINELLCIIKNFYLEPLILTDD